MNYYVEAFHHVNEDRTHYFLMKRKPIKIFGLTLFYKWKPIKSSCEKEEVLGWLKEYGCDVEVTYDKIGNYE